MGEALSMGFILTLNSKTKTTMAATKKAYTIEVEPFEGMCRTGYAISVEQIGHTIGPKPITLEATRDALLKAAVAAGVPKSKVKIRVAKGAAKAVSKPEEPTKDADENKGEGEG